MRRRRPEVEESGPVAGLVDPADWAPCTGFDGRSRPCLCWFSQQLDDIPDEHWPGGDEGKFRDWLAAAGEHGCYAPFDETMI